MRPLSLYALSILSACSPRSVVDSTAYGSGISTDPNPTTGADGSDCDSGGFADSGDCSDGALDYSEYADSDGPSPGTKFDTLVDVDASAAVCLECELTIASQQSGVFTVTSDNVFATANLVGEIVYAIGDYGGGRFVATADSSLPFNELTNCPLHEWLAGIPAQPTILQFGWTEKDGPISFVIEATVAGIHLPPKYIGHPELLAHDYDIVMYLEASSQFDKGDQPTDAEIQTLLDYVSKHGGGLYMVSEFADPVHGTYLSPTDLESVNRLMTPMGVVAEQVNLNWGNVEGNVDFACFPAPIG